MKLRQYEFMKTSKLFGNLKPLAITYITVIAFSNFVFVLFSQTVRDIIWSFFKDAGGIIILGMVFLFALTWLLKARPHKIPKQYQVIVFDIFEKESQIDGLRTEFKNHDVAWSFMKSYKKSYPLHSFAMVTNQKTPQKIIFKYI
uniref:Uncharacterized protein n=1 Tax=uncultured marine thaumarchaeote SAT1000_12_D12 TaxID=1456378 RepID=A0A075IA47_9ARCH|nr:hypothetical protein [uncultured marine thaumarchaeote SAT1000_12_D12]